MRTWSLNGTELTCLYEYSNYCGSLTYDFAAGTLSGHKPENMLNLDWFRQVKNFMSVCRRMIEPDKD